jgi:precorrin-2 dehydrogenase/sirohydrochlorin ferrochelatase
VTNLFPMFVKLEGRRCLVVGAGTVGETKVRSLLDADAGIHVVALDACESVQELSKEGKIRLSLRAFDHEDLAGIFMVVVATPLKDLNDTIYREAQRLGVLCNVVDDPPNCDFFYPAIVRRGALQIAVSTSGKSPSLAQKLRLELERQFGAGYAEWVEELGETRQLVLASNLDADLKRKLLQSLASRDAFEAALARQSQEQISRVSGPQLGLEIRDLESAEEKEHA